MRRAPLYYGTIALLLLLMLLEAFLPTRKASDRENRVLSAAPAFRVDTLLSGRFSEDFERFAADQVPFRDAFVSAYALLEAGMGRPLRSGVLFSSGRMYDRTDHWSARVAQLNAEALDDIGARAGLPAYLLLVPSAAACGGNAPQFAPLADERTLLLNARPKYAEMIPLLDAMTKNGGETLFYRTDHHWTAAGARVGYEAICFALDLPALLGGETRAFEGFYGSFYARSPSPLIKADTLAVCIPSDVRLTADGEAKEGLYDVEAIKGRDKYAALLYGNHALIELTNENAPDGTLFVLKDSYANALLPLLAQNFRRVVAVDARYFSGDILAAVKESEATKLLCVYGLSTFSTGRELALLASF